MEELWNSGLRSGQAKPVQVDRISVTIREGKGEVQKKFRLGSLCSRVSSGGMGCRYSRDLAGFRVKREGQQGEEGKGPLRIRHSP